MAADAAVPIGLTKIAAARKLARTRRPCLASCAPTTNGQAAAAPRGSVANLRRLVASPRLGQRNVAGQSGMRAAVQTRSACGKCRCGSATTEWSVTHIPLLYLLWRSFGCRPGRRKCAKRLGHGDFARPVFVLNSAGQVLAECPAPRKSPVSGAPRKKGRSIVRSAIPIFIAAVAVASTPACARGTGLKAVGPKRQPFCDSPDANQKKAFDTGGRVGGMFDRLGNK